MVYNLEIVIARINPTLVGFVRAITGFHLLRGANSAYRPLLLIEAA